jgi:hypothetical protein
MRQSNAETAKIVKKRYLTALLNVLSSCSLGVRLAAAADILAKNQASDAQFAGKNDCIIDCIKN